MTQKFGRNYRLTVTPNDGLGDIIIQPPLTCRFWVRRDILSSVNNASIDVYNLSQSNRRRIFQDRFNLGGVVVNGTNNGPTTVKLEIGYGNLLYTVWQGNMQIASTSREGVDLVTRIESLAGIYDIASSTVNYTMPAGSTLKQVFSYLIGQLPTLQLGFVSDFPITFPRAVPLSGKPWDLLVSYSQGIADLFTDNGKVYVMLGTDKLTSGGPIPVINAASGLLDTPRREQTYLSVTTLLEAGIQVNGIAEIDSTVEPTYNGQYAVIGLQHAGIISGAVSGDCRSTFYLLKPNFASYNQVQGQ